MKTTFKKKDLDDLSSVNPRTKYSRAKKLVVLAKKNPRSLYPHLDFFVGLLKSPNNILKWIAIDIIGLLSTVDKRRQIDKQLRTLYGYLRDGKLITASHAIGALANVALAQRAHRNRITKELLKVEHHQYETEECRNIALGKALQALESSCKNSSPNDRVLEFAKRQMGNARPATRRKAEKLLKRTDKANKHGE
jgi:hypothetical protein